MFGLDIGGGSPQRALYLIAAGGSGTNSVVVESAATNAVTVAGSGAGGSISAQARTINLLGDPSHDAAIAITGGMTLTTLANSNQTVVDTSNVTVSDGTTTGRFGKNFVGTGSAHDFNFVTNNATIAKLCNGGGIIIGAPTGGCQGAGTLNVSGGLYLNGTL
jgi:hypothetical protein